MRIIDRSNSKALFALLATILLATVTACEKPWDDYPPGYCPLVWIQHGELDDKTCHYRCRTTTERLFRGKWSNCPNTYPKSAIGEQILDCYDHYEAGPERQSCLRKLDHFFR